MKYFMEPFGECLKKIIPFLFSFFVTLLNYLNKFTTISKKRCIMSKSTLRETQCVSAQPWREKRISTQTVSKHYHVTNPSPSAKLYHITIPFLNLFSIFLCTRFSQLRILALTTWKNLFLSHGIVVERPPNMHRL